MAHSNHDHIDIATQLLNSHDTKVAAAAKRIFTPATPSTTHWTDIGQTICNKDITSITLDTQTSPTVAPNRIMQNKLCPTPATIPLGNMVPGIVKPSFDTLVMVNGTDLNGLNKTLSNGSCKKLATPYERLRRSRERNKIHARKTRQRKKEHMQVVDKKACDLKKKQINLKVSINEKNTANILLGMFSTEASLKPKSTTTDSRIEEILKRPTIDIPDVSKIPELPTLILPGHRNNRKRDFSNSACKDIVANGQGYPNDGIDYDLLARDRSKCTATELDRIRRERNRMHAKRTRDRKKRFMDEMEIIIRQLEDENNLLSDHLRTLSEKHSPSLGDGTPSLASPMLGSHVSLVETPPVFLSENNPNSFKIEKSSCTTISDAVTVSDDGVHSDLHETSSQKRRCIGISSSDINCVPTSITTTTNNMHDNR